MPSVSISIDSRGAEQGAAKVSAGLRLIAQDAIKTAEAIRAVEQARISSQNVGAQAAATQRVAAAERQLAADRVRAAREQSRADAERLRSQQQLERQLLSLRSTFGGAERGAAQFARGLQTLDAALARGIINTAEYNRLLGLLRDRTTLASVNSRDLRLNMLAMSQSFTGLASALGIAIPGMAQFAAATSALSAASKGGYIQLGLLAGIVSTSAVVFAGLVAGAVKSANALDELADTADSIGVSVRSLQELRFVALTAGVENVDAAITRFSNRLGELQQGSESLNPTLQTLGISFKDLIGLDVDAALSLIADRMKGVEDPTLRTAVVIDLFGKNASRMANILSGGSDELERTRRLAHALGVVIDEETIEAGKRLSDNLSILGAVMKSVGVRITDSLLEPLGAFVEMAIKAIAKTDELNRVFAAGLSLDQTREEIRKTNEELDKLSKFSDPGESGGLAGKAQIERLKALKERLAELTETTKAHATATAEQTSKVNEQIEAMRNELALGSLSERQRAISTAVLKLGNAAGQDQIDNAKILAGALFDQAKATRDADEAQQKLTATQEKAKAAQAALVDEILRAVDRADAAAEKEIESRSDEVIKAVLRADKEAQDELTRQDERAAKERAKVMFEPIRNAIEGVQNALSDAFVSAFDEGFGSAKSFFKNLLDLAKRTFAEIASAAVINLVLGKITGGAQATGGGGGTGNLLTSLLSSVFGGGGGGGAGGAIGNLLIKAGASLSTISSTLGTIASTLGGLLGGAAGASIPITSGGVLSGTTAVLSTGAVPGFGAATGGLAGIGSLALSGYAAAIVGGIIATINTLNTTQRFQDVKKAGGSAQDALRGGSLVSNAVEGGFFAGGGGFITALIFGILHTLAGEQSLRLLTAPKGSDPRLFQHQEFVEGPFGLVGLGERGTTQTLQPQAHEFARMFAAFDKALAKVLTDSQIVDVAERLQTASSATRSFREISPRDVAVLAGDRINEAFKAVFGDTLSPENVRIFANGPKAQEQFAKFVEGAHPRDAEQVFQNALAFLKDFNDLNKALDELIGDTTGSASEASKQIEALNEQFATLKENAEEMALSTEFLAKIEAGRIAAQEKLREGFLQGITDQILAIENPFELAKRELERQQDEQRQNAVTFNADMVELEHLQQLQREQLAKEALASIKALREEMLTGSTSSLSPTARITNAEAAFNEQLALVQAGNLSAAAALADAASTLRDLKREFLGGPSFAQFELFLGMILENLLGSAEGFASGGTATNLGSDSRLVRVSPSETLSVTHGPPPDPTSAVIEVGRAIVRGDAEQAAILRGIQAEQRALREENAELRFQLRRLLNDQAA